MKGKMRSLSIQGNSRKRSERGTPISFRDTALITTGSKRGRQLSHVHVEVRSKDRAHR